MLRFMGRILAAGLLLFAGASHAQVVVSQVYGAGGNTGATFNRDFVELFNRGTTPLSLAGLTVQYASATGTGNFTVGATLPNVNLAPGQYHLVGMSSGANGAALPTVDTSGTSAMATAAGKVVLVNSTSALACNGGSTPCSGAQQALIVDLVGYGTANFFEGTTAAPTLSAVLSAIRAGSGCTDSNQNGADFTAVTPAPRNSASPLQSCSGGGLPLLAVSDVSVFEGDSGTTTMTFGIGLNAPAGVGGVSITYATADGTATAGSDYVANSGTATIAEGATSTTVAITINGDTTSEANETFFVRVSAATGATISDGEGLGTIQNDDVTVVAIHDIQGSGLTSPLNGAVVTTEGIVTAQKFNNGFFLQTTDAESDADANTSQGIFVFTSTAPPATAAIGNRIRVTGTVTEFTPSTNLNQLSITEIVSVTSIQVLSTGNPLPAPFELTRLDFSNASTPGTAEKYEGMRVSATNAQATTGAEGFITESSATSSTTGVFHIVLTEVDRPFREPGIDVLDLFPIPAGKTPPRFDHNPERIMVRSRGQIGATAIALDAGTTIDAMVGVMDYFSGVWAVLPDPGAIAVSGGKPPLAVSDQRNEDVTIGAFNLLRFFDEVNDSNGAPTLTAAALDKRLTKTSLAICDFLKTPDILGVVEVENLRVLGLLADRINATCASAPAYVPYLVQGNDVGGINVGFLVSNRSLGLTNRVEVLEVTQFGKNTVLNNPDGSTSLLNDRPPLMLRAIVHHANGETYPVTVYVNHLRSLNGVGDAGPGSSGWPTENARVGAKRTQQAVFLANLVEARQQANPNERIVLLGDFNAFEFNDGYADVMGIIRGDEAPEAEVLTYAASPITTPLIDGSDLIFDPSQRYSYVFDGNLQTLDHALVNEAVVMDAGDLEVEHARINAEFGVHHFGTAGTALRVSDHDPVRLRISVPQFRSMDLVAGAFALTGNVDLGQTASFEATVRNDGPSEGGPVSVTMVFDALVTPVVFVPNEDWTCTAPSQTATSTTVTCTAPSLVAGSPANFLVEVPTTDPALANRSLRMDLTAFAPILDPDNANNQASASVNVLAIADLSVTATGPATPVIVGDTATFAAEVRNSGPQSAPFASAAFVFDALVAPVVTAPGGWVCAAPVQDAATTTVTCTHPSLASSAIESFSIAVPTAGPQQSDWTLRMAAAVSSQWPDNDLSDNTALADVTVRVFADLDAIVFTTTPSIRAGDTASFTSRWINNGPGVAADVVATFTFDALVSPTVIVPAGWTCGAPTQTPTSTTFVCNTPTLAPAAQLGFTIDFVADGALSNRDVRLTSAITSTMSDPFPNNNQGSAVVSVRAIADLIVTATAVTPSIRVGETASYIVNVANDGPSAAVPTRLFFAFDALVSPVVTMPAGWSCDAPIQDTTRTIVNCEVASLAAGVSAQLEASFVAGPALAGRSVGMTATADSNTDETNGSNNAATTSVAVTAAIVSDLSLRMVGGPYGFIRSGATSVHSVQVRNTGPDPVVQPVVTFTGNVPLSHVAVNPPSGWNCARGSTAGGFQIVCTFNGTLAVSNARIPFILAAVAPSVQTQTSMTLTSTVSSTTSSDPVPVNNSATYTVNIVP